MAFVPNLFSAAAEKNLGRILQKESFFHHVIRVISAIWRGGL